MPVPIPQITCVVVIQIYVYVEKFIFHFAIHFYKNSATILPFVVNQDTTIWLGSRNRFSEHLLFCSRIHLHYGAIYARTSKYIVWPCLYMAAKSAVCHCNIRSKNRTFVFAWFVSCTWWNQNTGRFLHHIRTIRIYTHRLGYYDINCHKRPVLLQTAAIRRK